MKEFTLVGMLEHSFNVDGLLARNDNLSITPTLMLNAGSSKTEIKHMNRYSANIANRRGQLRKPRTEVTTLQMESAGINLELMYSTGMFYIQPQLYLDYYLQATDTKKFTQIVSINLGITF